MRVNVCAEEMTDRVEIISKQIDGHQFTGLRFYLELPCTLPEMTDWAITGMGRNVRGPFMHRPGDDDSAAVTFWGKRDLRETLRKALALLDEHYAKQEPGTTSTEAEGRCPKCEGTGDAPYWDMLNGGLAPCSFCSGSGVRGGR